MLKRILSVFFLLIFSTGVVTAQTPAKNAFNSFALFVKKKEFSSLEQAKKFIDEGYKNKKDSLSYKNNFVRSLIYSALASVDSNRTLTYTKDPIEEALYSFERIGPFAIEHEGKISFIKRELATAFVRRANNALNSYNYEEAYDSFRWVDSLSSGNNILIKHNLAVLSQRLGYRSRAIGYYEQLISASPKKIPEYYLVLSELYENMGDTQQSLEIIQQGKSAFPENTDFAFKELNIFLEAGDYPAITSVIRDAINLDPDNIDLNYLAGFAFDVTGVKTIAEEYYKKVISLNPNNYDANYSLGLLYLDAALHIKEVKDENFAKSRKFLNKAYEINPNAVNVLKSLAILYETTSDNIRLKDVNNKLNQIIIN
ncbi:tetratricopeptide repeat protein [Rubrolithibacter danxiaensis]|uniref:tetratricopeptide repeat protein n=1 Tax=Rubrolithibacter danxiaensis TaxID=3390805 RepID=UPI003BF7EFE2